MEGSLNFIAGYFGGETPLHKPDPYSLLEVRIPKTYPKWSFTCV